MTSDLMTSAEACAELGIDRSTLSRWVASGKVVPAIKAPGLRGAMFFRPDDVKALAAETAEAAS